MSGKRYTEEFKIAAVKHVAHGGHPASEVAARFGISIHSLYAWTKRHGVPKAERKAVDAHSDEMRRLKAELKRVTEERDILKKAAVYLPRRPGKVHLNCSVTGPIPGAPAVQSARGASERFLCLAPEP